jgi:hypothetical protein
MAADAQELMRFVGRARERARRDAGLAWLATVLYAAFAVAAVAIPSGIGQGKFLWVVVAPIVALAAVLWSYSDGRRRGVETSRLKLITVPFGLLTLAFGAGALGWFFALPIVPQYGPPALMAFGYTALGLRRRNSLMVLAGVVVLVIAISLRMLRDSDEMSQALLGLTYVVTLLAARIGWRFATRTAS